MGATKVHHESGWRYPYIRQSSHRNFVTEDSVIKMMYDAGT
jgi:hypothetical protein